MVAFCRKLLGIASCRLPFAWWRSGASYWGIAMCRFAFCRKLLGNCNFAASYCGIAICRVTICRKLFVRVLLCFKQATAGLRFGGSCFVFSSVLHCVNLLGNSNFPGPALRQAIGEYRQIRRVHPCATVSDNIGNKPASKAQAAIRVVLHWSSAHRLGNQRRTNQRSTPTGDSMQSIGNMCRSSDTVQGSSWIASQTQESQV